MNEIYYLTTHSTHFIYGYMASDTDSERGNPLPPHGLLSDWQHGFFYMYHPTDRIAHTTAFVTPVMEHWLEREIAQWVHHEGSIRRPIAPRANALTTELHLAPDDRERNVLFNDALNTFYLRLYGVRHMIKDHSDSEKGNPLPPHRLLLSIKNKGSFICTIPQTG